MMPAGALAGLGRLDLLQVQPPSLALVMAGELLKPAPGMLVLRGDRRGAALLGLLMKETYVVHTGSESLTPRKVPSYIGLIAQGAAVPRAKGTMIAIIAMPSAVPGL